MKARPIETNERESNGKAVTHRPGGPGLTPSQVNAYIHHDYSRKIIHSAPLKSNQL